MAVTHHDDLQLIKEVVRQSQCETYTPGNACLGDPNCGRRREVLE